MLMRYTTPNGRLFFELEVESIRTAFVFAAKIAELFEEKACGCCKSEDIFFEVREVREFTYFVMRCRACNAQLDFSQKKDMKNLYIKRWDSESKKALPNGGWYVWSGNRKESTGDAHEESSAPLSEEKLPF